MVWSLSGDKKKSIMFFMDALMGLHKISANIAYACKQQAYIGLYAYIGLSSAKMQNKDSNNQLETERH